MGIPMMWIPCPVEVKCKRNEDVMFCTAANCVRSQYLLYQLSQACNTLCELVLEPNA